MSLIDDALKRAREQGRAADANADAAAVKDAAKAPADPWEYAPLPEKRANPAVAIGAVVGLLAVAGIVAVFAVRRDRGPAPRSQAAAGPGVRAAVPTPKVEATPFATVFVPPPPRSAHRSEPVEPPAAVAPSVGAPHSQVIELAPSTAPAMAPTAAPAAAAPPAIVARTVPSAPYPAARPAASASNASDPVSHEVSASGSPRIRTAPAGPARNAVGSFTAPNGHKIELGGIVFTSTPVALLNGRVVGVGGMVEGLTVDSIEENRVELSGEGVHVYLALK